MVPGVGTVVGCEQSVGVHVMTGLGERCTY